MAVSITVASGQTKGVFYILPDHLGTPRAVTDESNKIVWKNDPLGDPFGADAPDEDPDGDGQKFTLNLRFPGQYFDQETGTSYNYFRDYDPSTGRYVESDPIGLRGGQNTYTYVEGSPESGIDPLGLARKNTKLPPQMGGKPPENTDGTPDGTKGILCALGFTKACLPSNLFICKRMRCTPKCGDPYYVEIPSGQVNMTDPDTKCQCVQTGINPKFNDPPPGL